MRAETVAKYIEFVLAMQDAISFHSKQLVKRFQIDNGFAAWLNETQRIIPCGVYGRYRPSILFKKEDPEIVVKMYGAYRTKNSRNISIKRALCLASTEQLINELNERTDSLYSRPDCG